MFWTIYLFLGSPGFAAMVGTMSAYMSEDCSGNYEFQLMEDNLESCAALLARIEDTCAEEWGDNCNEITSFPFCLVVSNGRWVETIYNTDSEESIGFECTDVSDAPTLDPTAPTCTDSIQNGDELGVDCGGSCDACPASCDTFDCGMSHFRRDDPEDIDCESAVCNNADDLDTCCIARELCSQLSNCPTDEVLIVASNSTYCQDDNCNYADDADTCCTAAGDCDGFTLCDSETQYLKDSPGSYKCDSVVCDASDISTCCHDKQPCSAYFCDYGGGLINKANDENIYCQYNDCSDDPDASITCCEDRESCSVYICPDYAYVNKSDKDSELCGGANCNDDDWAFCCDDKARCVDEHNRYVCSSAAQFDLSSRAEYLYCDDTVCESPRDDANCCIDDVPSTTPTQTPSRRPTTTFPSRPPTVPPSLAPFPVPSPRPTPVPSHIPGWTAPPTSTLTPTTTPTLNPTSTSTPTSTPTTTPTAQPSAAPSAASVEVEDCEQNEDIDSRFSTIWEVEIVGECVDEDTVLNTTDVIATYLRIPCTWVNIRRHSENDSWNVTYEIFYTDETIADDLNNDIIRSHLRSNIDEALNCGDSLSLVTTSVSIEALDTDPGNDSGLSTGIIVVIVVAVVISISVMSVAVYKVSTKGGKKTRGALVEM